MLHAVERAMHQKGVQTHFAFGKNWASYAKLIGEHQVEEAKKGLLRLIPAKELNARSFLDIGCGSGLHALAAAELGVSKILAIDVDPESVATSTAVLSSKRIEAPWRVETMSVFDLKTEREGVFDIVYSWGVLHHTGDMWGAISKAASMVAPNGLLVIALYRKTYLDPFWQIEKRFYARAPQIVQSMVRNVYVAVFRLRTFATGKNFRDYVANYKSSRGMEFYHNVHDWLGGYPYETTLAPAVDAKLVDLGFNAERVFAHSIGIGVFGSGCDEYVYRSRR